MRGFKKRKREAAKRGKYRGFGVSCFLEHSGGVPTEGALLEFPGGENLVIALGVQSTGQGPCDGLSAPRRRKARNSRSQVIASPRRFIVGDQGWPRGRLALHHHRRQRRHPRRRSHACKSKNDCRACAGSGGEDIVYRERLFEVIGTDRMIPLFALAERAQAMKRRGEIAEDLDTKVAVDTPQTFPNGCHIAEIEIDPDTGHPVLSLLRGRRCGNVLDHVLVEGQIHGGLAQGLGQACSNARCMKTAAANSSPAPSWITPCRARCTCRRS
jgi:carbon-monoxide dehydrogenase large subunit